MFGYVLQVYSVAPEELQGMFLNHLPMRRNVFNSNTGIVWSSACTNTVPNPYNHAAVTVRAIPVRICVDMAVLC